MLRNFSFMIEKALAGSALPGGYTPLLDDLAEAREAGITAVVTLTEQVLPRPMLAEAGLRGLHIPIPDYHAPSIAEMDRFVAFVDEERRQGGAVLAHCYAGIGRTGTMLAAYLVSQGRDAREAIAEVRRRRRGSIETNAQEAAVLEYERHVKSRRNP